MATVSMPRQPFGVLDSPRLSHLSGIKNRQKGIVKTPSPLSAKAKMAVSMSSPSLKSSSKRRLAPSFDDFDLHTEDAENVNPESFLSSVKRTKMDPSSTSLKPKASPSSFNFTFTSPKSSPSTSMPPPSTIPSRLHTPLKYSGVTKPSTRTPLTAPAGRSPKSKRDRRRLSAHTPITRIDSPALLRSSSRTGLPFSLDAALSGSLTSAPTPAVSSLPKPASSIEESMPNSWFFAIHEDTPDEEAENLMEHSTLTLDISSDDESTLKSNEDRGKENVAPADYEPSSSSPSRRTRRSPKSAADMETDESPRSALGQLDTAEFIPDGLTKDSIVIVHETPEPATSKPSPADEETDFAVPIIISTHDEVGIVDVVSRQGDLKGEFFIFEDESATPAAPVVPAPSTSGKRKRSDDEC